MNAMFALAMNPNLTEEQFMDLSRQALANQVKLTETFVACAEQVKAEHGRDAALRYVTQCLPILLMF